MYGATGGNRALRANFGDEHLDDVSTHYVSLHRWTTGGSITTVLGTEMTTDGNYARVAVLNDDDHWEVDGLTVTNLEEIRWPIATDLYSIGANPANQWAIYDLSTGGNLICWGTLSPTLEVTGAGDQPVIPAGTLVITQVL